MSEFRTFREKLAGSTADTGSIACMGIDPVLEALPSPELSTNSRVLFFFRRIFEEMHRQQVLPGAFKPNIGFFHCLDRPLAGEFHGTSALQGITALIREMFPRIPLIFDMKRGDIARSSANYAAEAFTCWEADAVTISPYMGGDSTGPFIEQAAKTGGGVYILNRTSNPGARELQNLIMEDGRPLYMHVAGRIRAWGRDYPAGTVGAVVGATSPSELGELAGFYAGTAPDRADTSEAASDRAAPLLIPGVGGQGGSASETVRILREAGYPLELVRINSSSGLTHPWHKKGESAPEDFAARVTGNLRKLNEELKNA
ncbi:MAG: orotidine-5'-phosphate decarboxylase [Spirochaetota bacterium]|nr:orotidine-5'-phosphate decarboxylase [Spirochaetota bacterium]